MNSGLSLKYFNREVSWLAFNRRVLLQAQYKGHPLLERLRFLSIFTSNLDEFFMKRVGGLKKQIQSRAAIMSIDGMTPKEQIKKIREIVQKDLETQHAIYEEIQTELKSEKIFFLKWEELSSSQKKKAKEYFFDRVFPVLTPLTVDPSHPFPFISNFSTSLAVKLKVKKKSSYDFVFSRIKIPTHLPWWIQVEDGEQKSFISVTQVLRNNLKELYPGMKVLGSLLFRVTRNAVLDTEDEDTEDLMVHISEALKERKFAEAVRLEILQGGDPWLIDFLRSELSLHQDDIFEVEPPIDFTSLKPVLNVDRPDLKYGLWRPIVPMKTRNISIFDVLNRGDMLVHHPYESFKFTVEKFIREAANDPKVLAIKITLYRTGDESPIVDALIQAAEKGKQVVCLVELQARFDEKRNIRWAQIMENVGIHVVYGLVGYKTHSKVMMIIREEEDGNQIYAHIGTGNYHTVTSNFYTDLGLLTTDPDITHDLMYLFNYLTSRAPHKEYNSLLVAPLNMKERFFKLIQDEVNYVKKGKPGRIIAKMNSLEDKEMIEKLYKASQAGVEITLFVRGFCSLVPGIKGVSDNIEVYSVIGRFLEHSRIYFFGRGKDKMKEGDFYIGSADWMYRNLNNRVEIITPIKHPDHKAILETILEFLIEDKVQSWKLEPSGKYSKPSKWRDTKVSGSQENLQKFYLLKHQ